MNKIQTTLDDLSKWHGLTEMTGMVRPKYPPSEWDSFELG